MAISGDDPVHQVIRHLFEAGGKKIRPILVLASASFNPINLQSSIDIAAAIEMIHMASLVHDDIIDGASMRRGRETINHKWDKHIAVLAGDYLFASAFELLMTVGDLKIFELAVKAIRLMCEGEINQDANAFNINQSEEEYFNNIYKKTAALLATSCHAGALSSSLSPEQVTQLCQFGLYLGYAYQILDDILDLVANPISLGKPVGSDLAGGILTLPILRLLQDARYSSLKTILSRGKISREEINQVVQALIKSDGLDYSFKYFIYMLEKAEVALNSLPAVPARNMMKKIAYKILEKPLLLVKENLNLSGYTVSDFFKSIDSTLLFERKKEIAYEKTQDSTFYFSYSTESKTGVEKMEGTSGPIA